MSPRVLVYEDNGVPARYACGVCSALWVQPDKAEACCLPPKCLSCGGAAIGSGPLLCQACTDGERVQAENTAFASAVKLLYAEYDGTYLYWSAVDRYFRHKTAIDAFCEKEGFMPPRWVWGTMAAPVALSAELVLQMAAPEALSLLDTPEIKALQDQLDTWATQVPVKTFKIDYNTAVVLDSLLYEELARQFRPAKPPVGPNQVEPEA